MTSGAQLQLHPPANNTAAVSIEGTEVRCEGPSSAPLSRRAVFLRRVGLLPGEAADHRMVKGNHPGTMKVRSGKRLFTVYCVNVTCGDQTWCVYKRYSEFDHLDKQASLIIIHFFVLFC